MPTVLDNRNMPMPSPSKNTRSPGVSALRSTSLPVRIWSSYSARNRRAHRAQAQSRATNPELPMPVVRRAVVLERHVAPGPNVGAQFRLDGRAAERHGARWRCVRLLIGRGRLGGSRRRVVGRRRGCVDSAGAGWNWRRRGLSGGAGGSADRPGLPLSPMSRRLRPWHPPRTGCAQAAKAAKAKDQSERQCAERGGAS